MSLTVAAFVHPRRDVVQATGFVDESEPVTDTVPPGSGTLRDADRKLLVDTLRAGRIETSLASIAYERGTQDLVRQLAGHVRFDYAIANRDLMALLAAHHVGLPPEDTDAVIGGVDGLGKMSGTAFDRAYVAHLVKVHEGVVAQFTKAASGTAPDIASFAERTLPLLQDHLDRARELKLIKGW